jgi:hypothetical protein
MLHMITLRMGAERQLRIVQIACILVVVMSIRISLMVQGTTHGSSLIQWIVIVLAFSCAVQGFTLQRRIITVQVHLDGDRDYQRRLPVGEQEISYGSHLQQQWACGH